MFNEYGLYLFQLFSLRILYIGLDLFKYLFFTHNYVKIH